MSPRWRNTVDSVVKGIGSLRNKPQKRLSECLPPADRPVTDAAGQLRHYNGWHVFASGHARNNFIKTALILLSDNGTQDISNLTFDNFYNRSYDGEGNIWYTASIVAMDDFAIRNTILASSAGTTKASAFRLLMLDVEIRMGALLRDSSANISLPSFISPRDSGIATDGLQIEEEEKPLPMPVLDTSLHRDSTSTALENVRQILPPDGNPAANDTVGPLFFDLNDLAFRSYTLMASVEDKAIELPAFQ